MAGDIVCCFEEELIWFCLLGRGHYFVFICVGEGLLLLVGFFFQGQDYFCFCSSWFRGRMGYY